MNDSVRGAIVTAAPFFPAYFLGFYTLRISLPLRPQRRYRVLFLLYCLCAAVIKGSSDFHMQLYEKGQLVSCLVAFSMVITMPLCVLICFSGNRWYRMMVMLPYGGIQTLFLIPGVLLLMGQKLPMPYDRLLWVAPLFFAVSLVACVSAALITRRLFHLTDLLPEPVRTILAVVSLLAYIFCNVEQAIRLLHVPNRVRGISLYLPSMFLLGVVMALLFTLLVRLDSRQALAIASAREKMSVNAMLAQQHSLTALQNLRETHRQSLEKIESLLAQGEDAAALQTVQALIGQDALVVHRYADNPTVDISLADTARRCREAGVKLTVSGAFPKECTLPPTDLASLLYNLFSNAATAAALAPKPAKVEIDFRSAAGRLCVTVRNSTARQPARAVRRKGHGFGCKILAEIVSRYDGSYTLDIRDGEAVAVAMVCMPKPKERVFHE